MTTASLSAGNIADLRQIKTAQAQKWADIHWGKGCPVDAGQVYFGTDGYPAALVYTVFRNPGLANDGASILTRVEQKRALRDAAEQRFLESEENAKQSAFAAIDAAFAAMRFDDEYGTIVMSIDPQFAVPMKFYDGLPPHYVALEDMKDFAREKLGAGKVKVNRLLFASFLDMYAEVTVNGRSRIENILRPGEGMQEESLQGRFTATRSEAAIEAWLEKFGEVTEVLPPDDDWYERYINGVPDYNSVCRPGDSYSSHRNGCAPAASGCVLGYWDDRGYTDLVDGGGSSHMGSECGDGFLKLCWCELGPAMGYNPNIGTYISYIDNGIRAVTNDSAYNNNYNFYISNGTWYTSAAADRSTYHSEINAWKPFVYTSSHSQWNYGWHTMAACGYKENLYWHYRIAHDNNAYTAKKVYFNEVSFSGSTHIIKVSPGYAKHKAAEINVQFPSDYSLNAYPNPFNPATKITWSIIRQENVHLRIFNATGALVFSKDFGAQPAGQHSFTWHATDNMGKRVASGSYILQIQSGGKSLNQRITLLK